MNNKKICAAIAGFFLLAVLAGCGAPDKAPEEVVKTGLKNFYDIDSSGFNLSADLSADGEQNGKKEQVAADFNASGKYDSKDKKSPKFDAFMSGNIVYENKKYDGELALKLTNKKLYFNLLKYPELPAEDPQSAVLSQLANKWFFVDAGEYENQIVIPDESSMTPEQKQIKEEFDKRSFFKDLKYKGKEKINGAEAYKYSGIFDNDNFYEFALKAAEINKNPATDQEKADLKKVLDNLELPADIFISVKDEILVGLKGVLRYKNVDPVAAIDMKFDLTFSDLGQQVVIEEPQGAVDLLKAMTGGM